MGIRRERLTTCICPKCQCTHEKKMDWIGNGIPRKYCPSCLGSVSGMPAWFAGIGSGNGSRTSNGIGNV